AAHGEDAAAPARPPSEAKLARRKRRRQALAARRRATAAGFAGAAGAPAPAAEVAADAMFVEAKTSLLDDVWADTPTCPSARRRRARLARAAEAAEAASCVAAGAAGGLAAGAAGPREGAAAAEAEPVSGGAVAAGMRDVGEQDERAAAFAELVDWFSDPSATEGLSFLTLAQLRAVAVQKRKAAHPQSSLAAGAAPADEPPAAGSSDQ
ncbi:unnamed protein product, partial [Prorocentrum cordatum]